MAESIITKESLNSVTNGVLTGVSRYSVASGTSLDIPFESLERGFLIGVGASGVFLLALANTNNAGTTSGVKIDGSSTITLTNGTNKLTINNSANVGLVVIAIRFK